MIYMISLINEKNPVNPYNRKIPVPYFLEYTLIKSLNIKMVIQITAYRIFFCSYLMIRIQPQEASLKC